MWLIDNHGLSFADLLKSLKFFYALILGYKGIDNHTEIKIEK